MAVDGQFDGEAEMLWMGAADGAGNGHGVALTPEQRQQRVAAALTARAKNTSAASRQLMRRLHEPTAVTAVSMSTHGSNRPPCRR
mgnify:CR=1 FL=1